MKEGLVIIASLILASFIVFSLHSGVKPEYYEYKGKLRTYQLYAELESIEPRAMIYARSLIDGFLTSANGSSCTAEPKNPDPNAFREILAEDLGYKGFLSSIDLDFIVSKTLSEGTSSGAFGSYCRRGGISVKVSGEVSIEDDFTGIRGRRYVQSIGCQQTAYYTMREALNWIESEIRVGVERSSKELPNATRFLRVLGEELRRSLLYFRRVYPELELQLRFDKEFYLEEGELRAMLHFTLTLRDPYGVFIKDGEERKGFWCIREVVLIAEG